MTPKGLRSSLGEQSLTRLPDTLSRTWKEFRLGSVTCLVPPREREMVSLLTLDDKGRLQTALAIPSRGTSSELHSRAQARLVCQAVPFLFKAPCRADEAPCPYWAPWSLLLS